MDWGEIVFVLLALASVFVLVVVGRFTSHLPKTLGGARSRGYGRARVLTGRFGALCGGLGEAAPVLGLSDIAN